MSSSREETDFLLFDFTFSFIFCFDVEVICPSFSLVVDFNKCTHFQSVKNDENITEPWHLNSEKNENDMVSCENNVTDGDGFNQNYQFSDNNLNKQQFHLMYFPRQILH
jgi:hypothetical protein